MIWPVSSHLPTAELMISKSLDGTLGMPIIRGQMNQGLKMLMHPRRKIGECYFVLNEEDYQKAFDALQKILWPYQCSEQQVEEARKIHGGIKTVKDGLTIKDMRLGSPKVRQRAWIEYMKFEVNLIYPRF